MKRGTHTKSRTTFRNGVYVTCASAYLIATDAYATRATRECKCWGPCPEGSSRAAGCSCRAAWQELSRRLGGQNATAQLLSCCATSASLASSAAVDPAATWSFGAGNPKSSLGAASSPAGTPAGLDDPTVGYLDGYTGIDGMRRTASGMLDAEMESSAS